MIALLHKYGVHYLDKILVYPRRECLKYIMEVYDSFILSHGILRVYSIDL